MQKKILFITPDLGRTGSEMVLWYLLNNLEPKQYDIYVFCLRKGALYDKLPNTLQKRIAYRDSGKWYKKLFRGILKMMGIEPIGYQLKQIHKAFKADLWYTNTILIPQAASAAFQLGVKNVTHFHEVEFAFGFIKSIEFKNIIEYSDTLIGCSERSFNTLKLIAPEKTELQYSFIDEKNIIVNKEEVDELRRKFNVLPEDFVWVISGSLVYMKGLDIILQIMENFKNENVKIIWIGGSLDNGLDSYVKTIAKNKYIDKLFFEGSVSTGYYNYFGLANGFLMLSKEESFSLVMVEAAYLGLPIISFNTGIANKLITSNSGALINIGDVDGIISAMREQHVKEKVGNTDLKNSALEFIIRNQLPHFEKLIDKILKN